MRGCRCLTCGGAILMDTRDGAFCLDCMDHVFVRFVLNDDSPPPPKEPT